MPLPIWQFVPEVHLAGGVAHHGIEKQPGVLADSRLLCGGQRGLGNLKDTLDMDVDTFGTIPASVGISGLHKKNAGFSLADIAATAAPEIGISQIGGLRFLGGNQQGIADGIPLEFGLHIQVGLEIAAEGKQGVFG